MSDTIFMIHGMFGGTWCWENFRAYFEQAGYQCLVPVLRLHEVSPLAPPPPGLGSLSLLDYASDLEAQIRALPQPPIIMGHSMGGLLTQILAGRGLGKAAVCLCPASPRGVLALKWSVIKTFRGHLLRWGFWRLPHRPSFAEASYGFLHLLSPERQREIHGLMVHESGRAAAEIGFWPYDRKRASAVDAKGMRCPMLVVAGGQDRATPSGVVRKLEKKYAPLATFREFPQHAHSIMNEEGWPEVAAFVHGWLRDRLGDGAAG